MRKKALPGEGKNSRAEQFSYTSTQPGLAKVWYGWCAAEPYWCLAHEHTKAQPGTKVCVNWYTDGEMICPRCKPAVVPSRIGYVFLYREVDHKPVLVIVHESAEDLLKGVVFGVRCMVGCVERGASVFVRPAPDQTRMLTENPLRKVPCDIALSLHTLWGYGALAAWDAQQNWPVAIPKVNALTDVEEESTGMVPLPHDRLKELFEESAKKLDDAAERSRRNAAWVSENRPKANGNGKHKPKG